jgi:hypothetical protein
VNHYQGAWITPPYSAATFTASGSMTWTVDAGDVTCLNSFLNGKALSVKFSLDLTSVGGTLSNGLQIAIPGGFSCQNQSQANSSFYFVDNGGAPTFGLLQVNQNGVVIRLLKLGFANWLASTNATTVYGTAIIDVA